MTASTLSFLFFLSGFAGLVYEVLWARYLGHILGNTALAHTIVLSAYMGGLAAGYAGLGRWADRSAHPLRLYGWLELGISVMGILTLPLLDVLGPNQVFASLCLVFIPACLMGGTLPALCRWAEANGALGQDSLARLYFLNSAGASLGALTAGFCLIPWLGLDVSLCLAAALNLGIGLKCLREKTEGGESFNKNTNGITKLKAPARMSPTPIFIAVFLSGFAAMTMEIVWIRLLALVLGSSAYSFSIMLAAFIFGISLGALAAEKFLLNADPRRLLGASLTGTGLLVLALLPFYETLPYIFRYLAGFFTRTPGNFYVFEAMKFQFCLGLMLPPTIAMGLTLPLAGRAVLGDSRRAGSDVGALFSANTLGNVLGAALSGLILLPRLGLRSLLEYAAFLDVAAGLLILWKTPRIMTRTRIALSAGAVGFAACYAAWNPPWDLLLLTAGEYRSRNTALPGFADYKGSVHASSLLYYKDDAEGTVTVEREITGKLILRINGKVDAGTGRDMKNQMLLAHLPLVLKPGAGTALIIGLGSGITAGSALAHPLERLDVAEISPAVVEAARFFSDWNRRALEDPRLSVHVEDARTFLGRAQTRYDVIISEPSNPWVAGLGNLFSMEFYGKARSRLSTGGIMAQWFHFYEMDSETAQLIVRTFSSVFPHVTLWSIHSSGDIIMIGSMDPPATPFEKAHAALRRPDVRADLERAGVTRLATLLSLQFSCDSTLRRATPRGPLNEDRFPILEYRAPKAFFTGVAADLGAYDDRKPERAGCFDVVRYLTMRRKPLSPEEVLEINVFHSDGPPAGAPPARPGPSGRTPKSG